MATFSADLRRRHGIHLVYIMKIQKLSFFLWSTKKINRLKLCARMVLVQSNVIQMVGQYLVINQQAVILLFHRVQMSINLPHAGLISDHLISMLIINMVQKKPSLFQLDHTNSKHLKSKYLSAQSNLFDIFILLLFDHNK